MKKTVHYTPSDGDYIVVGQRAVVNPTDHPDSVRVSNTKTVLTSPVVGKREDGSFETLNTLYIPLEKV